MRAHGSRVRELPGSERSSSQNDMHEDAVAAVSRLAALLGDVPRLSQQSLSLAAPLLAEEFSKTFGQLYPRDAEPVPGIVELLERHEVPRLILSTLAAPWPRDGHFLVAVEGLVGLLDNVAWGHRRSELADLGAVESLCRITAELPQGSQEPRLLSGAVESVSLCLLRLLADNEVTRPVLTQRLASEAANATAKLLEQGLQKWAGTPALLAMARLLRACPPARHPPLIASVCRKVLRREMAGVGAYLAAQEALAAAEGNEAVLRAVDALRAVHARQEDAGLDDAG